MRVLRERSAPPLVAAAPAARSLYEVAADAGAGALVRPAGAEIVAVGASAGESLGLALEAGREPGDSWRVLTATSGRSGRLALPIAESTADLRLRLWSLDRRPATAEVTAFAGAMQHCSEGELARGCELSALPGSCRGSPQRRSTSRSPAASGGSRWRGMPPSSCRRSPPVRPSGAAPTLAPVGFAMPLAAAVAEGENVRVQARRACRRGCSARPRPAGGYADHLRRRRRRRRRRRARSDGGRTGSRSPRPRHDWPSTAWGPTSGGRVRSAQRR